MSLEPARRLLGSGLLAVYKPRGMLSAATVGAVKRALASGYRGAPPKVGHGGTLDSHARGVLVIGINDGCKRLGSFLACDKEYIVEGALGHSTTTDDLDGQVMIQRPYDHVTHEALTAALASFVGRISQAPPVYSAVKRQGVRLSDAARQGRSVDIEAAIRTVIVHEAKCISFAPPLFRLYVRCGSGTYIRSIVRDLGDKLQSAAHVTDLERTRQGIFSSADAVTVENWNAGVLSGAMRPVAAAGLGSVHAV
eukprot:Opistho-2@6103